ncbi:hypothetical protein ASPWEDRAFT_441910 [Aspergillus wentii DTO 134E9]|uniref:Uncharacterized protein n=1 Tax=Aspergillus wentii DTO 134E9 TaxID=1073089 RepID=A0A1L9RQJ4_ASPWE|nr:uncharacterized protein ASPWEDRAFT_441910 [Aspergillus wentii DTO 134E9]OJJ37162.1 hypothetical protein ASPWEDRAFT_441910 [Aspergillus wentii DTO 134E9]
MRLAGRWRGGGPRVDWVGTMEIENCGILFTLSGTLSEWEVESVSPVFFIFFIFFWAYFLFFLLSSRGLRRLGRKKYRYHDSNRDHQNDDISWPIHYESWECILM